MGLRRRPTSRLALLRRASLWLARARLPAIRFALVLPPIVSDGDPDPKSLQFSCRHQAQLSLDYSATRARNGSSQGSPPRCAISPGQYLRHGTVRSFTS